MGMLSRIYETAVIPVFYTASNARDCGKRRKTILTLKMGWLRKILGVSAEIAK